MDTLNADDHAAREFAERVNVIANTVTRELGLDLARSSNGLDTCETHAIGFDQKGCRLSGINIDHHFWRPPT